MMIDSKRTPGLSGQLAMQRWRKSYECLEEAVDKCQINDCACEVIFAAALSLNIDFGSTSCSAGTSKHAFNGQTHGFLSLSMRRVVRIDGEVHQLVESE